ncbi:MAG: hypothetical protein RMJ87_13235 [Cytophagales bacterium]|nr:hypothetical protein [Bernardetiaceae bacterium]MDW8205985.1 hypothetical protein [Cytophagales bacterium]
MEIILPPGITGYAPNSQHATVADASLAFTDICETLAYADPRFELQGFVRALQGYGGNHDAAVFTYQLHKEVIVLCNLYHPYVGFVINGQYADVPELKGFFTPIFTVLPAELLSTRLDAENPLSARAVSRLHPDEFGQMTYRQPEIVGDIVFHRWV